MLRSRCNHWERTGMTQEVRSRGISKAADDDEKMLDMLQQDTFAYFIEEINPDTGLVADRGQPGVAASIAATGFALAAYPASVERGGMECEEAIERTLTTLRFFWNSPQSRESWTASSATFTATWPVGLLSGRMMAAWLPGRLWPPCPSHPKLSCQPSGISSTRFIWNSRIAMGSRRPSIPRGPSTPGVSLVGSLPTTTGSTKGRSS